MRTWISSLVVVFALAFTAHHSHADTSSADQSTAAPALASNSATPAEAPQVDSRASTYRSVGSGFIVVGGLLAVAGLSMAVGRDEEALDDTGSSGNAGGRPLPAEVTIAGIGLAGFVAGLFLTAEARKLEAAQKKTTIAPTVSGTGVGVAVFGRF